MTKYGWGVMDTYHCEHTDQRGVPGCACVLCKSCGERVRKCNAGPDCKHEFPDAEFAGDLPGEDEIGVPF